MPKWKQHISKRGFPNEDYEDDDNKRAMRIPALLKINSTGIISLGNLFILGLEVKVHTIISYFLPYDGKSFEEDREYGNDYDNESRMT